MGKKNRLQLKGINMTDQTNDKSQDTGEDKINDAPAPSFPATDPVEVDEEKSPVKGEDTVATPAVIVNQAPQVIDLGTVATAVTPVATPVEAPVSAPAPVAVEPVAKVVAAEVTDLAVSVSDTSDLAKLLNKINAEGTTAQKALVTALQKYMEDMQPGKPMTSVQGSSYQARLWEIFRGVIENPAPDEFRRQMFIIRAFFKRFAKEKTALNDHYIHRFAEAWTRNPDHLRALQRLINIFNLTADPLTTKENLKHVDLRRSLEVYFTEATRQRVIAYFQQ